MRVVALISAGLALAMAGDAPKPALRLKVGDSVSVTSPYGGDFQIMGDGAIYGRGFGRLQLEGKTWEEAQASMRKALHKYVRAEEVNLTLKDLRRPIVYLVGMSDGKGCVDLTPNLGLRQLLASAKLNDDNDLVQAQIFRDGRKIRAVNVATLISGSDNSVDEALEADDVVTLTPIPFVRVWVAGMVTKPGQIKVPAGTDAYRAVAEAGGFRGNPLEQERGLEDQSRIIVRRGPETFDLPLRQDAKTTPFDLEPGDTVSVVAPEAKHITIAGEVERPGEVIVRGDCPVIAAVAKAGGVGSEGTLANVLVMRRGDLYSVDATAAAVGRKNPGLNLESGDLVYVQRNERSFIVLGEVMKAGKVTMKDGKPYHLSDALSEAGGLSNKGTLRRVALARPDDTGKVKVHEYHLDQFLKDGKMESNPEIHPGDCVLFGQPKGINITNLTQVLSGAIMFESLARGR
jgi:protein involved in polysaccharide export with SLBB domain